MLDIRSFGADTGSENNAAAIQAAIDACYRQSGGTVLVAQGRFATGTIELKSGVCLRIERGASLLGTLRYEDYPHGDGLVFARGARNVSITGGGAILGRLPGTPSPFPYPDDPIQRRPRILCLSECRDVLVEDISLCWPHNWCTVFHNCEGVRILGVRVESHDIGNGDGINFNGGHGILIRDCVIDSGDDSISLKSCRPQDTVEDVLISGCILRSPWAGIRIGAEAEGDIRNVLMSHCIMRDCGDGIKVQNTGHSVYEHMQFTNIVMDNVLRPFFITLNTFSFARTGRSRPEVGVLRDVLLRDITARYDPTRERGDRDPHAGAAILGLPGHPVESVRIENLRMLSPGGCHAFDEADALAPELLDGIDLWPEMLHLQDKIPASGIMARHVKGLVLRDCAFDTLSGDKKPMLFFDDAQARLWAVEGGKRNRAGVMALGADVERMDAPSRRLETIGPSPELLSAHARKLADDIRWQAYLLKQGKVDDAARALPVAKAFAAADEFRFSAAGDGPVYAYLPLARGAVSLRIGSLCARRVAPEQYSGWRYYWAVDITDHVAEDNRLFVSFEGDGAGFLRGKPSAFTPSVWQEPDHFETVDQSPTAAVEIRTKRAIR